MKSRFPSLGCLPSDIGHIIFCNELLLGSAALVTKDDVSEKLDFAQRRLSDVLSLIQRNILASELHERQQLVQEFFFHLIGAADVLAQFVNERRNLGLDSEVVTISKVAGQLPPSDPLAATLRSLYVNVRARPVPADPYSDEGYLFRAYNYRHQVTHRRRNPFNFRAGGMPAVSFKLDPRDSTSTLSTQSVEEDMRRMLKVFHDRCNVATSLC